MRRSEFIIFRPAPRGRWDSKPAKPAVERVQCGPVEAEGIEEANAYAKIVWGEAAFCLPKEEVSK